MSVEIASVQDLDPQQYVLDYTAEELQEVLAGIWGSDQPSYDEIAELFRETHDGTIDALQREKRRLVLDALVDSPVKAVRGEFLQLEQLYEQRRITSSRYDGSRVTEFCTQNHERAGCDYLFRHTTAVNGAESYEISKVFTTFGEPALVRFLWQDDTLRLEVQRRFHGRNEYVPVHETRHEQLLGQLFFDTIQASAAQIERSAVDRELNDRRAMQYLRDVRTSEYLLV